ncbi:MAG: rhamnulokinase family protein [Propionicimonas sp.]
MSDPTAFAAVDLGASSGRVILGTLAGGRFRLAEAARFPNGPTTRPDGLRWDAVGLFEQITRGIDAAQAASGGLTGVGVDTWGVDYALLDAAGRLRDLPFNYRDERTQGVPERVFADFPAERLYAIAGLQVMSFNTIFQLVAEASSVEWADVFHLLLMPDLFSYWLTGRRVAEVTNASTTGLLDVARRTWSSQTCGYLKASHGIDVPRILPELVEPGTLLGDSLPGVLTSSVPVVAVGSHDTASAVVSVPAETDRFAFISSGTWSLVGLELDAPVLTDASRQANFTNELGVDGTVRYLTNVMGLWVLSESMRAWRAEGRDVDLPGLLGAAARLPGLGCVLDMADERLLPPGDMPARLLALAQETGQHLSPDPDLITRCILDSLALAYRRAVRRACALADRAVDVVHIVGGGSQNTLLCQLTAEATGLPVVAGPAEGTALGNLLVQARACGALSGDLAALRRVAIASSELVRYTPGRLGSTEAHWDAAERVLPSER